MAEQLTPKQQHVLAVLREDYPLTAVALAARLGGWKADSMRRMLDRLAERRLVGGQGRGSDRVFALTTKGARAIGDQQPAPLLAKASDRSYAVLRQMTLLELLRDRPELADACDLEIDEPCATEFESVQVFVPVAEVEARNTEDAYRQAVRVSDEIPDEAMLVAVSGRYWQPTPVTSTTHKAVTIG